MKIRTKCILLTSSMVVLTTAAIATLSFLLQKRLIQDTLEEGRRSQLSAFASVCRQALAINDELLMINQVKLLRATPGVSYAYFADSERKVVVHSDSRLFYRPLAEWRRPAGTINLAVPVELGRAPAGAAVIGFSQAYARQRLRMALDRTLRQVAVAAFLVGLAGICVSVLFSFLITRPLKVLAVAAAEIGKGNFNATVEASSDDELGELASRFNEMARSLAMLDELKDQFIASVSHDLRNPLGAIMMMAEFLLYADPDREKVLPKHREFFMTIMDNARRLGIFINNILDAAKIKAGRMEYHAQAVALAGIAADVVGLFSIVAKRRDIQLEARIPADLPAVQADRERFEQVVANLVSNALKFTEKGGTVVIGGQRAGERVDLYIQDTGQGIASHELPKLFQRFSQADVAGQHAKGVHGTGLGLYIVKTTVENMGGTIRVESELGRGTRFTVSLPCAPAPAAASANAL